MEKTNIEIKTGKPMSDVERAMIMNVKDAATIISMEDGTIMKISFEELRRLGLANAIAEHRRKAAFNCELIPE